MKHIKTIEYAAEKQTKAIEGRVEKQILYTDQKSITNLFSKDFLPEGAIHELNMIKEIDQEINSDDLIYKANDKEKSKT